MNKQYGFGRQYCGKQFLSVPCFFEREEKEKKVATLFLLLYYPLNIKISVPTYLLIFFYEHLKSF